MSEWRQVRGGAEPTYSKLLVYEREVSGCAARVAGQYDAYCGAQGSSLHYSASASREATTADGVSFQARASVEYPRNRYEKLEDARRQAEQLARDLDEWRKAP